MNVSEHSVLTMDSLLLDSSDDDSVQSLEYDGFDCSCGGADNYFEVYSFDARDNGNDQEELKEDYSFACEKGTAYPRITQHNRSALDEQNKHKPHSDTIMQWHLANSNTTIIVVAATLLIPTPRPSSVRIDLPLP